MRGVSRTAEAEIADRGLGVRDPQELIYSVHRSALESCIVKADDRTIGTSLYNFCGVDAGMEEGQEEEYAEEHPWWTSRGMNWSGVGELQGLNTTGHNGQN